MPTSETFKRAARRTLERVGTTATVTHYTDGATDEHGDPAKVQDAQDTDVPALFRRSSNSSDIENSLPMGTDAETIVFVWLPADQRVDEPGESIFPSRITNDATGNAYDVVDVYDEQNGQQRVLANGV